MALTALLAKYERGITGTASPSACCLRGFAGEKGWQRPVCSVHLTPPNSSQPLALWVIYSIYFIAPIIPRTSLARECACVEATALSIIPNGKSLSPRAWRDGNNGKSTLGWMDHQEHSSQLCAGVSKPGLQDRHLGMGFLRGLHRTPHPWPSLPQQRFAVSKDSWAMGAKQSFVLRAGQCHCSPWHVGVSTPSIFSALCPGKQDLARAQPAVAEV